MASAECDTSQQTSGFFKNQKIDLAQGLQFGIERGVAIPELARGTQDGVAQEFPDIVAWLIFHTDRQLQVFQDVCMRRHDVKVDLVISNYHFLSILQKLYILSSFYQLGRMAGIQKKWLIFTFISKP
jgi:hypothetical protein